MELRLSRSASGVRCKNTFKTGIMNGQVYSLIAILLAIPVMLFIAFYVTETQNMRYGSLERIVSDQLHEVESGLEKDFVQAMGISGKRAFLAATDQAIRNGVPFEDSANVIEELITNGTILGEQAFIMRNQTIQEWIEKISSLELGFEVEISYTSVSVRSHDGMNAELDATLIINVSDFSDIARISRAAEKEVAISLSGVEDPVFPLNTMGFVNRLLRPYPYPYHAIKLAQGSGGLGSCSGEATFDRNDPNPSEKILVTGNASGVSGFLGVVTEGTASPSASCYLSSASGAVDAAQRAIEWSGYQEIYIDADNRQLWSLPVKEAAEEGYYSMFGSGGGPDILMRMENDLSTSASGGMESFVNLEDLQSEGITVKTGQVSVDYLYFSDQTITGQAVRGMPGWFSLNGYHADRYNLTELMS